MCTDERLCVGNFFVSMLCCVGRNAGSQIRTVFQNATFWRFFVFIVGFGYQSITFSKSNFKCVCVFLILFSDFIIKFNAIFENEIAY